MSVEHYSATLVSHELAHKWFGNYITCYWWSNTWINEGYASYFGYMATHQVNMSRVQILKKNIHKYLVLNNSTIYLIRYFPNMNCTITSIPATFKHHWRLTLAPVLFLSITMWTHQLRWLGTLVLLATRRQPRLLGWLRTLFL